VKDYVVRAVDDAHSTFTDLGDNPAMAQNLADQEHTPCNSC
jgi:hypothetical protein